MLPEEQESGQEIMLQEDTHNLPGSIQAICMQEHRFWWQIGNITGKQMF